MNVRGGKPIRELLSAPCKITGELLAGGTIVLEFILYMKILVDTATHHHMVPCQAVM